MQAGEGDRHIHRRAPAGDGETQITVGECLHKLLAILFSPASVAARSHPRRGKADHVRLPLRPSQPAMECLSRRRGVANVCPLVCGTHRSARILRIQEWGVEMKDRLAEIVLSLLDAVLDCVTFGAWSQLRGDVVPNIKIKARQ